VTKVFKSDIFEWARDLAIIHRIFGTVGSSRGELVEFGTIRPAAGPARDEDSTVERLAEANESSKP